MTAGEWIDLDPEPGTRMLIKDHFIEAPHDDLVEYLGTTQVLERVEKAGEMWLFFEGLPQPFALSEIECVVNKSDIIDEEDYCAPDMTLIFGEVAP